MDNDSYAKNNLESQVNGPNSGAEVEPAKPTKSIKSTECDKCSRCNKFLLSFISCLCGFLIGSVGVFALMQLLPKSTPGCNHPEAQPLETASDLTFDFLQLENNGQNVIYSPLSIRNGLALLSAGAAGETKAEIDQVLPDAPLPHYDNLADELSLANAVFIRDTFEPYVLPEYVSTVEDDYQAEVIYDSFAGSATLDDWADQKTFGLIKTLGIQPSPDTEMVLANALAIQMDWVHTFDSSGTKNQPFYLANGSEVATSTMTQTTTADDVYYYQDNGVTALTLPLQSSSNAELDFVAIMPEGDLSSYIRTLNSATVSTILDHSTPASTPDDGVEIYIPKFNFDYELKFADDLAALGITTAFTSQADFSRMASQPLYVSAAIHKANIDFSEQGIKAAAVTAFAMDALAIAEGPEPQPVVIKIDHPFVFLIRDRANGATWFTGAVYQPTSESGE